MDGGSVNGRTIQWAVAVSGEQTCKSACEGSREILRCNSFFYNEDYPIGLNADMETNGYVSPMLISLNTVFRGHAGE